MLSTSLRVAILIGIIVYYFILIMLLRQKRLTLKYTLLWLFSGVAMLLFALFPQLLGLIGRLTGVEVGSNGLFAILFFCMMMILMSITAIVSKMNDQIKRVTQHAALLEYRLRQLEAQREEG